MGRFGTWGAQRNVFSRCTVYFIQILLPSAVHLEERLTVSQAVPEPVSQTETHSLGFLSVADTAPSSGDSFVLILKQWPNGNAAAYGLFGWRFEPRSGEYAAAAAAKRGPTRIRTADHDSCGLLRYYSTGGCVLTIFFPTAWSLLSKNF